MKSENQKEKININENIYDYILNIESFIKQFTSKERIKCLKQISELGKCLVQNQQQIMFLKI